MAAVSDPWRIFVIQHSHIDIGFTHRQEVIADYHRQFISQAVELALSPDQEARPPETRFKFTCEGFWAVEQFLKTASPEQRSRFIAALRRGDIELSATYLHFNELLDEHQLRHSFKAARQFAQANDIVLTVAMSCDVNGLPWATSDGLLDVGVDFLCTNINPHHGGNPFGRPLVPFYWQSRSGRKLLVWSGLPYHKANLLGLMGGRTPDQNPGIPGVVTQDSGGIVDVNDISLAERKIFPMIDGLAAGGYPLRFLPVMGSGLYTDNSPPSDKYCALIAAWNTAHGGRIRIETATLAEFGAYLRVNAGEIATHSGDWPDWWSDGVASSPRETKIFRHAQRSERTLRKLGLPQQPEINHAIAVAAEHTYGHSRTDSGALLTQQVFLRKSALTADADTLAGRAWDAALRTLGEGNFTASRPFTFSVINPGDAGPGIVQLPIDSWEQDLIDGRFRIIDFSGHEYPHQIEAAPRGWRVSCVAALAATEKRIFSIERCSQPIKAAPRDVAVNFYENDFFRVSWETPKGIVSLIDRATQREIVDPEALVGIASPIYQIFPRADRSDAAGFNFAPRRIPAEEIHHGCCTAIRTTLTGPVFTEVEFDYAVPATLNYCVRARFYHGLPRIELGVATHKLDVADPEGLYAAFPFALEAGVWHLDRPGAAMRPGVDQLPGTCCDYYCVQDGAALVSPRLSVILAMPDVPMVHIGGLNLWKYTTERRPTGTLYSWLTNNKWETNFPRYCGGNYEFRYTIALCLGAINMAGVSAACAAINEPFIVCRH